MNEIRWKRGIPTEEECREWHLIDGGDGKEPRMAYVTHAPGDTRTGSWESFGWYAAVRILPPESDAIDKPPFDKPFTNPRSGMGFPKTEPVGTIAIDPGEGYRWLVDGEIVKDGDEGFAPESYVSNPWFKITTGIGKPWDGAIHVPFRRKVEPSDDPEEWVGLPMQHRIRAKIDQYEYQADFFDWVSSCSRLVGIEVGRTANKRARCRRKDLPPLPTVEESSVVEPAVKECLTAEGPQPGQFYEEIYGGVRVYVVGFTERGTPVLLSEGQSVYIEHNWKNMRHLPWCKSFDDVEPKKTKTQRKWVPRFGEAWIDKDAETRDLPEFGWELTNETREVPVV